MNKNETTKIENTSIKHTSTPHKLVYISGALHQANNLESLVQFYELTAIVCSSYNFIPFVPHLFSHPQNHSELHSKTVFHRDAFFLLNSKIVIAYVGEKSLGVGAEIAFAYAHNIPILLCHERGKKISRFIDGMDNVDKIEFTNNENWTYLLGKYLQRYDKPSNRSIYPINELYNGFDINLAKEKAQKLISDEYRHEFYGSLEFKKGDDTKKIEFHPTLFDFSIIEYSNNKIRNRINLHLTCEVKGYLDESIKKKTKNGYEIVTYSPESIATFIINY